MRKVNVTAASVSRGENTFQWSFTVDGKEVSFYLLQAEHARFLAGLSGDLKGQEVILGDLGNIVRRVSPAGFEFIKLSPLCFGSDSDPTYHGYATQATFPGRRVALGAEGRREWSVGPLLAVWASELTPSVKVCIREDQAAAWWRYAKRDKGLRDCVRRLRDGLQNQAFELSLQSGIRVNASLFLSLDSGWGRYTGWLFWQGFADDTKDRGMNGLVHCDEQGVYSVHT